MASGERRDGPERDEEEEEEERTPTVAKNTPLYFYSTRPGKPGAMFSNFSDHPFVADDGLSYWTNEHYFQAQKFAKTDPEWAASIRLSRSPSQAKKKGGSRSHPMRADWNLVRERVMYKGLELKALCNDDFLDELLASGARPLFENSPSDYYWGIGHHQSGQNRLGHLLMKLRGRVAAMGKETWKAATRRRHFGRSPRADRKRPAPVADERARKAPRASNGSPPQTNKEMVL